MNEFYGKVTRQTGISALATLAIYGRSVFLIPVITGFVAIAEYGIWVQVVAIIELTAGFATLGLGRSLVRFASKRHQMGMISDDLASILVTCGIAASVFMAVGIAMSEKIAIEFTGRTDVVRILQFASILLPASTISNILLSYFRASRKVYFHSMLLVGESFGYILISYAFLSFYGNLWGILAGILVSRTLLICIALAAVVKRIGLAVPSFKCIPQFLKFGVPLATVGVFSWVNNASDRCIVGFFNGAEAAGSYAVSYAIGSMAGVIFAPIFFVLVPAISELWDRGDLERIQEYLRYAYKLPILLALPVVVIFASYHDKVVELLSSADYVSGPLIVFFVGIGIIAMNVGALAEVVTSLEGNTVRIPMVYGVCAAVNFAGNLAIVPDYGAAGAAAVTFATYLLGFLLMRRQASRSLAIEWQASFTIKCITASVVLAVWLMYFGGHGFAMQLAVVVFGLIAYAVVLVFLKGFSGRELRMLRSMLPN